MFSVTCVLGFCFLPILGTPCVKIGMLTNNYYFLYKSTNDFTWANKKTSKAHVLKNCGSY